MFLGLGEIRLSGVILRIIDAWVLPPDSDLNGLLPGLGVLSSSPCGSKYAAIAAVFFNQECTSESPGSLPRGSDLGLRKSLVLQLEKLSR